MTPDLSEFSSEEPANLEAPFGVPPTVATPASIAAPSFRRSQFRTPFITPEAAPTSTLFRHYARADIARHIEPPPARRSAQDVAADLRRRVAAALPALAKRLRPAMQVVLANFAALSRQGRPFAKPLAVVVIATTALGALGLSGWLLITTLIRPAQPAATRAAAAPAEAASTVPAKVEPVSLPKVPAQPQAAVVPVTSSITERAMAVAARAAAVISPSWRSSRTTSIVLPADRSRSPAASRAPIRAAAAPVSAEPTSPIDLQPAASSLTSAPVASPEPPAGLERVAEAPAGNASASPASVDERWPLPPPVVVYSSVDADVVPPVQVYPQYIEAIERERPNASPFLIVIDENGHVESATLARYPTDMRQAVSGTLLLSAAKAWRFRPATKDGQPVKYRRIVWFANQ